VDQYQWVILKATPGGVRSLLHRRAMPTPPPRPRGMPEMDKMKYFAQRATLLLSTVAAYAFLMDGGKRW
jgi:hypothetical protein